VEGPTSFVEASAILLALWVEVEGPAGRTGASGVGGTTAGDGLVFGGFWPGTFLLLCAKSQIRTSQIRDGMKSKRIYSLLSLWQFDSSGMLRNGIQVAAQSWGRMAGDNPLA
jgi:hypothetical protein